LPARIATGSDAFSLQRNGEQRAAGLLAGGGDHVEFAAIGLRREFAREPQQTVGFTRHGGGDNNDLVACGMPLGDAARHIFDALDRAHRRAAILMDD